MFVYFPVKKSGRAYKFAKPFQGPYLVEEVINNGVQVKRAGQLKKLLRVALNRVRRCPKELTNFVKDDDNLPEGGLDMEQFEAASEQECQELGDSSEEQECTTAIPGRKD